MNAMLNSIFDRFKESYYSVLDSNLSVHNKPLYLENLKEENKNLIKQLFGESGVEKFEALVNNELRNIYISFNIFFSFMESEFITRE